MRWKWPIKRLKIFLREWNNQGMVIIVNECAGCKKNILSKKWCDVCVLLVPEITGCKLDLIPDEEKAEKLRIILQRPTSRINDVWKSLTNMDDKYSNWAMEENINKVIVGKENAVRLALITLLCKGHLLLEDVPGVGKTVLAKTIAKSISAKFNRIQFTPDLLPSDITGTEIYQPDSEEKFIFQKGPIFNNLILKYLNILRCQDHNACT